MKNLAKLTLSVLLLISVCVIFAACTTPEKVGDATLLAYELSEDGQSYRIMGIGSFEGEKLIIPEQYEGKPVTEIYVSAFSATGLVSVVIPESITKIGAMAFSECTSLVEINIPNSVKTLNHGLFSGCTSLKTVTLPESVDEVGQSIFSGCSSLKSITLPSNIKAITGQMFKGCSELESLTVPDGVEKIQIYSLRGCSSLKALIIPDSVTVIEFKALENCSSLQILEFKGTSEAWEKIEKRKFWDAGTGNYTVKCTDKNIDK